MKDFFKNFFASLLGTVFAWAFFGIFSLVVFIAICAAFSSAPKTTVPEHAFLVLDLNMNITDAPEHGDALSEILGGGQTRMGLWDLTQALKAAETDRRITGVFLRGNLQSSNFGSGYAALAELRRAISDFKNTGKPVIAYLDQPSFKDYYVATAAGTIFLNPFAALELNGPANESFYLGAAFKKYGIGVQTTKVGKYKSAVEPFIAENMSDADRAQRKALLSGLWDCLVNDIATARGITAGEITGFAETAPFIDAGDAEEKKLVDKTAYLDEVIQTLKEKSGEDELTGSFAQIGVREYAAKKAGKYHTGRPAIAVVYAEGEIVDGNGDGENIGGDSLAAQLRALRNDPDTYAVVLRVNSPGGSAFASEVIQRETRLLRENGIPIIVSMGSYAASGGYWISAYGDKIFAEKTTITGSIGVFGLMFNIGELSKNLGINFDGVKTTQFADMETISRPKTPAELALLQVQVDKIYDAFLAKVSEGRNLARADVEKIAEGRVWSGEDAKTVRLVDAFGGLRDAVDEAAKLSKIPANYVVVQYPEPQTALQTLAAMIEQSGRDAPVTKIPGKGAAARISGVANEMFRTIKNLNDRRGVYARMPYSYETN